MRLVRFYAFNITVLRGFSKTEGFMLLQATIFKPELEGELFRESQSNPEDTLKSHKKKYLRVGNKYVTALWTSSDTSSSCLGELLVSTSGAQRPPPPRGLTIS
eukprot:3262705-Amphidinium_carterae.1